MRWPGEQTSGTATAEEQAGTATVVEPRAEALVPIVPEGVALTTGGPPVALPVIVRNTGSTPVAAPTLVLTLPDGVQVVGSGNNLRGRPLLRWEGAVAQAIGCGPGKGTVTCRAEAELPAGGSVTFLFRLLAGPKSTSGTITGTVTAAPRQPVRVEVPVAITQK
ncbi:hypothetical protein AB0G02_33195 [Actinosynnema sp. NPDC023658]|uniref:hypothetical protein n=1 Tax=Actinosynnema sp. NPDC023658 TaxID=3155465 RepID=UPI0033C9FE90